MRWRKRCASSRRARLFRIQSVALMQQALHGRRTFDGFLPRATAATWRRHGLRVDAWLAVSVRPATRVAATSQRFSRTDCQLLQILPAQQEQKRLGLMNQPERLR